MYQKEIPRKRTALFGDALFGKGWSSKLITEVNCKLLEGRPPDRLLFTPGAYYAENRKQLMRMFPNYVALHGPMPFDTERYAYYDNEMPIKNLRYLFHAGYLIVPLYVSRGKLRLSGFHPRKFGSWVSGGLDRLVVVELVIGGSKAQYGYLPTLRWLLNKENISIMDINAFQCEIDMVEEAFEA